LSSVAAAVAAVFAVAAVAASDVADAAVAVAAAVAAAVVARGGLVADAETGADRQPDYWLSRSAATKRWTMKSSRICWAAAVPSWAAL